MTKEQLFKEMQKAIRIYWEEYKTLDPNATSLSLEVGIASGTVLLTTSAEHLVYGLELYDFSHTDYYWEKQIGDFREEVTLAGERRYLTHSDDADFYNEARVRRANERAGDTEDARADSAAS